MSPMLRRGLVALGLTVGLVLGVTATASAHATVVSTSPNAGTTVATAPASVSVVFDEPVETELGALRVFAPDGSRVDDGTATHPGGRGDTISVGLHSGLRNGTYTVSWRVISADSHPVAGGFTFNIGAASATTVNQATLASRGSRTVGVVYGVARWAAFAGFMLLVGTGVFIAWCWPAGLGERRLLRLLGGGWALLAAATVGILLLQGPYGAGLGIGKSFDSTVLRATLETRLGTAVVARLIILGVIGLAAAWVITSSAGRFRRSIAAAGAVCAAALAVTWAASDHAGTGIQPALAMPVDVVHLLAGATWLGGVAALAIALRGKTDDALVSSLPRFSTTAYCCVVVMAVTGIYQAWRGVGSLPALLDTSYGRLLLLKLAGVVLMLSLGSFGRTWVQRYAQRGRRPDGEALGFLRRSVGYEAAVGAAVLAATSVLVAAPPGRDTYSAPASPTATFDTGGTNGTGSVNAIVDPARIGTNTIHVYVVGPSGQSETVAELDAWLELPARSVGPIAVPLSDSGPGHYSASMPISIAGRWQLKVTVRTSAVDEATVYLPVEVR